MLLMMERDFGDLNGDDANTHSPLGGHWKTEPLDREIHGSDEA